MADMTQVPINGNYPAHGYPDSFNHASVTMNTAASFQPAQSSTPTTVTPTDQQKNEISKDEVGWYFVEQYYTTMSRNPDKLHLFYSRRSQLVFGTEAESVPVTVGTKAINDKIKQLDFQECKVRVLNVDSQASFDNILVSVIGEISNKSEPSRKFVQTFVLAEQPNGYYVLNDIFRYMVDEEEEIAAEPPTPAAPATETPKAEAPVEETQVTEEVAATKVDEKLEEAEANGEVEQPEEAAPQTNGTPAVEETPAPVPAVEAEIVNDEKPETPEPSPVPEEKDVPEKDAAPTPAVPKTWASIALAGKGPAKAAAAAAAAAAPAAPAAPATSATPAAPKAAAPAAQASAAQPAAASPAPETARPQETGSTDAGWQTAGHDHKKSQPRAGEEQTTLAYIKNVNEKVDASLLKQTLARFGKLKYFDVSRPKNCAFVEFEQASGYAAAVAANPHQIGSEQILVEERRPRGNAFGGNGFPAGRGSGRGRGDRAGSQGRGGFQRDGRGGFAPRGRGGSGNVAAKGRSQAQAA